MKSTKSQGTKNFPEEISIAEAAADWLIHNKGRFTKRTQVHYRMVISRFVEFLPEGIMSDQLHNRYIENYISTVISNYTNRTGNAHLTVLKSFHRWLSQNYDELPNYAARTSMLKEDPPKQRFLTYEDYVKVLKVTRPPVKSIIEFISNTGVRDSEFRSLTWNCVDWNKHMLIVIGKGRKRRFIPLNQTCMRILFKLRQPGNGPIFTTRNFYGLRKLKYANSPKQRTSHRINLKHYCKHEQYAKMNLPLHRSFLYPICSKVAQVAGIEIFGPHSLRHLFATELLRRGVAISYVSKLLGHQSIRTTERIYIHWQPEFLNGITDCLVENKDSNP